MPVRLTARFADRRLDKWFGLGVVAVNALARMALSVLVARLGGPPIFAVFVGLTTVEIIVRTLLTARYVTPLMSIAPALPTDRQPDFVGYALRQNLRGARVATAAIGCGVAAALPLGVDVWTYLAFCAYLPVWLWASGISGALATTFRNARAMAADGVGFAVQLAGLCAAPAFGWPVLATLFVSGGVGHGCAGWIMRRGIAAGDPSGVTPELRSRYRRLGRDVVAGSVANSACSRVQPFVLGGIAGAVAVGMFGAANTLVGPVRVFGSALGEVLRPRLALFTQQDDGVREQRRALGVTLAALLGAVAALLALFAVRGEWLVVRLMGSEFRPVASVLPWALLFATVAAVVTLLVVAMQTLSADGALVASRWRIGVGFVSLGLVVPACAAGGAQGAFAAMALAETVFLVAALRFLRRRTRVDDAAHAPASTGS